MGTSVSRRKTISACRHSFTRLSQPYLLTRVSENGLKNGSRAPLPKEADKAGYLTRASQMNHGRMFQGFCTAMCTPLFADKGVDGRMRPVRRLYAPLHTVLPARSVQKKRPFGP